MSGEEGACDAFNVAELGAQLEAAASRPRGAVVRRKRFWDGDEWSPAVRGRPLSFDEMVARCRQRPAASSLPFERSATLKRLRDSKRFKRKRSSSLSSLEASLANRSKLSPHDDLVRSASFRGEAADGCRSFSPSDFEFHEMIGQGFFGQAFRVTHVKTQETLVIKSLCRIDAHTERSFLKEAVVMRRLSHPNVLRFVGVLYKDKLLHLITEFVSGGTLRALIEDVSRHLSWQRRVSIAKDIVNGMIYLHSTNIVHRDLNSGNVLIREETGRAVVADFGLARQTWRPKCSRRRRYTTQVGNPYWMAPEMLREANYDERVDVFSFGITLCELLGRCTADPDVLPRSSDFGVHHERFAAERCAACPAALYQVAVECTRVDAGARPSFVDVACQLDALVLDAANAAVAGVPAKRRPPRERRLSCDFGYESSVCVGLGSRQRTSRSSFSLDAHAGPSNAANDSGISAQNSSAGSTSLLFGNLQ